MYYTVYKTTNIINGKIYVGCHKTENLEDKYVGSGLLLSRSIDKYGLTAFEKEYLAIFNNKEEMFEMEAKVVNAEFVSCTGTYNLKEGGNGGWEYVNDNDLSGRRSGWGDINKNGLNGGQFVISSLKRKGLYDEWISKLSKAAKGNKSFLGKKHTEETKRKIGEKNSAHQKGSGNSHYGTCWIYSLEEKRSIRIPKEELEEWLSKGWIKGRKMKFD